MKIWKYFIYLSCFFLSIGSVTCRNPIIKEYKIPSYGVIKLRAYNDWELSVPIYFEVHKNNGKTLISGPFYYAQPETFKSNSLKLVVNTHNDIAYIKDQEKVDTILAMSSLTKDLVYPPNSLETEQYYTEVDSLFNELKKNLGNSKLKLYR